MINLPMSVSSCVMESYLVCVINGYLVTVSKNLVDVCSEYRMAQSVYIIACFLHVIYGEPYIRTPLLFTPFQLRLMVTCLYVEMLYLE